MRLRLLVPRRGRGRGRRGLRPRAAALLAGAAIVLAAGCGGDDNAPPSAAVPTATATPSPSPTATATPAPAAPSTAQRLPIGLTEFNAQLVRPAGATATPGLPEAAPAFATFRHRVAALRPRYVRLVVDWSRVGADPSGRPDLAIDQDGCSRHIPPCAAYAGLRGQLEAIREQQRKRPGGWEVVVTIAWTPPWAGRGAQGCERPGTEARSRPITDAGLRAYRRLIGAIGRLGREVGVPLRYWSPFNEANQISFVSPQRATCDAHAPTRSPAVYTRLVRAAREELRALGGDRRLVLGELAGLVSPSPRGTTVGEFLAALPDDVACAGDVWAQHQYARVDDRQHDAVGALERALDARPCTTGKPIWVTEAGVVGGGPRGADDATLRRACRAQHTQLRRWDRDDRIEGVFQYTLRDDPFYPVALFDAGLTRTWPVYDVWKAWARARESDDGPPELPASCAR